jgi:hypothetical protein
MDLLINLDLLSLILSNLSIQYKNFHWANTTKTSPIRIFSVLAQISVRPITARSESTRRFDNRKEKSREMSVVG